LGGAVFVVQQNVRRGVENEILRSRLDAIGGAREVEDVTRKMDDCGKFAILVGGLSGKYTDGELLGCGDDTTGSETGDGGIPPTE